MWRKNEISRNEWLIIVSNNLFLTSFFLSSCNIYNNNTFMLSWMCNSLSLCFFFLSLWDFCHFAQLLALMISGTNSAYDTYKIKSGSKIESKKKIHKQMFRKSMKSWTITAGKCHWMKFYSRVWKKNVINILRF